MAYDEIASALGYSNRSGAWKAVKAAVLGYQSAAVDHYLLLAAARQDALLAAVWPMATGGDLAAVDAALKIIDAQIRVLGLDQ